MSEAKQTAEQHYDFPAIVEGLTRILKLRSIPIGLKRFKTVAEMEAIPRIRRPKGKLVFDQAVAQARMIGWTVGITADDLIGHNCGAPLGLKPRDKEWLSGEHMVGVWYGTPQASSGHQNAMDCASYGDYEAVVVSPLTSGRLDPPDICLFFGTPGQMIFFINGLQYWNYKKLEFSVVGESACADSWGKALATGEPSLSIPCYAERSFGGVADDELLMAIPPSYLKQTLDGLTALNKNGFRYPFPTIGVQTDPTFALAQSYEDLRK